jgi:hypothetical protein
MLPAAGAGRRTAPGGPAVIYDISELHPDHRRLAPGPAERPARPLVSSSVVRSSTRPTKSSNRSARAAFFGMQSWRASGWTSPRAQCRKVPTGRPRSRAVRRRFPRWPPALPARRPARRRCSVASRWPPPVRLVRHLPSYRGAGARRGALFACTLWLSGMTMPASGRPASGRRRPKASRPRGCFSLDGRGARDDDEAAHEVGRIGLRQAPVGLRRRPIGLRRPNRLVQAG